MSEKSAEAKHHRRVERGVSPPKSPGFAAFFARVEAEDEATQAAVYADLRERMKNGMTLAQAVEAEAEAAQVVAKTLDGRECTRAQLTAAFNRVAPTDNWKLAIDTTIQLEPLDREVVREAVIFFTGSVPKFEYAGCCGDLTCRVTAAGYYATCGA